MVILLMEVQHLMLSLKMNKIEIRLRPANLQKNLLKTTLKLIHQMVIDILLKYYLSSL